MPATLRLAVLTAVVFFAACERPFEPLAPTDIVFSIYGHLDAAADTQWIRVMPIRETLETSADPIDAVVTLEELETGTSVVLGDSLIRYLPLFGDDDLYAHNFWTTMPIVPGRHYRLTATRADGAAAWAEALAPVFEDAAMVVSHSYYRPTSTFQNDTVMAAAQGRIRGTRHLGMVVSREDILGGCDATFPIHQEFLPVRQPAASEGESHGVQLSWVKPLPQVVVSPNDARPSYVPAPPEGCILGPKRILAIASGGPWIHDLLTTLREQSHPESIDNIEGRGLGFFTAVQTQTFPYERCFPIQRTSPCTITFDARSATLVGIVSNDCEGQITPRTLVRFQELSTNAMRVDTTVAGLKGTFEFKGLDPEIPLTLNLDFFPPPPTDIYGKRFFPMDVEAGPFEAGGVDTISIELKHRVICGV